MYDKIVQLKLISSDGKKYQTDYADVQTLLRIIQAIPSPKAEPIKQWLAQVGYERIKEMVDPSTAIDRARETYKKLGRSEKWISQRMTGQETRNKLTDYWSEHDIKEGKEYAILTDIIHKEWSGLKENAKAAKTGGNIAKKAKEDFEQRTGSKVVNSDNFLPTNKQKKIKKKD